MVDLPVKKIVLYKHGVGYVERQGKLKTNEITLQFKRGNMNDILKSLLILDATGKVTGVSYESHEEASEKLKNALVVQEGKGVLGLLKALIGHEVSVAAKKMFTGKIVGVQEPEKSQIREGFQLNMTEEKEKPMLSLLDAKGKTHFIGIEEIKSVSIVDNKVLRDLQYFLELSAAERKHNVKSVTLHLSNDKLHDLSVSYIIEMPVWRASYRFAYDEKNALIQGWGIIDNSLEEDLENVQVSLVAGQPISFVYDFYAPPQAYRPVIQEQARAVSAPVEMEYKKEMAPPSEPDYGAEEEEVADRALGGLAAAPMMKAGIAKPQALAQATSVQAKTVDLGAFFRYDILNPVTIKRGESAMLPILQQKIDSEKIFVYNKNNNQKNPMLAIRFKNKTGLTLERGPLTIYDEGMYAGEAILPFTPDSAEQFIVYAVELGIEVSSEPKTTYTFKESYLSGFYLVRVNYEKTETNYSINNKTKRPAKLLLEHAKRTGYDLVDSIKPEEETESYYRWNMDVPAGKTIEFRVTQGIRTSYSEYIQNMTLDTLEDYFKNGIINKKLKESMSEVVQRTQVIKEMQAEKVNLEAERERFLKEQERLRKNIGALSQSGDEATLRKKYVKQLDSEEERIQEINTRVTEIDNSILQLQKEINEIVSSLS